MEEIAQAVMAAWLGAVGIALTAACLRLHHTVQQLSLIVRALARRLADHERRLARMDASHTRVRERLMRLELEAHTGRTT